MSGAGARLGIEIGATGTRAVVRLPDGSWRTVWSDVAPGVFVDGSGLLVGPVAAMRARTDPQAYVVDPIAQVSVGGEVRVAGRDIQAADLLAAVLRPVAEQARRLLNGPPHEVVLVVPAGWGPQRRMVVRQAAHRAGLTDPCLVAAPAGVAAWSTAVRPIPGGRWMVVADLGTRCTVSVLRPDSTGWEVVVCLENDAGGQRVDALVVDYLTTVTGVDSAMFGDASEMRVAVRAAKEALSCLQAVTVPLPSPTPPVVLTAGTLRGLVAPVAAMVADLVRQAVQVAEVPPGAGPVFVLAGGAALCPTLVEGVAENVGCSPPPVVFDARLAALYGATYSTGPPNMPRARTIAIGLRVQLAGGVAALVPGTMSLATVCHALLTGKLEQPGPYSYLTFNYAELGLACLFILLASQALTPLVEEALADGARRQTGPPRRRLGSALLATAGCAVMMALMYAIGTASFYGVPAGPMLRWAMLPLAAPLLAMAASAVIIGTSQLVPPGWLRFPSASVVCAGVGMAAVQWSQTTLIYHNTAFVIGLVGRVGGLLLGVGAAVVLVDRLALRLLLGVPLGLFCAVVAGVNTNGLLTGLYATAVALWWARRVWHLIDLTPRPMARLGPGVTSSQRPG